MQAFKKYTLSLFLFILASLQNSYPQEVPHPIRNTGVYEFLDELASLKIIELNSAIKPYSRLFIAERLKEEGNG